MKRFSPGLIIGLLLAVFFGVSLIIRMVLPWDQVFGGQVVRYTSIDGYFYMRLVDNTVHNFPHYTAFDPYQIFPGGGAINYLPFFYWIFSGIIWIFGLGHPSQHLIDVFGALFPPLLAALTVVPVYYIGRTLFNRWAGLTAAALMAVFPGEYLGRSILGFTDTPVIETFFTATAVAFLVLAVRTAADRQLGLSHLLKREKGVFLRPVIFSLLAGVFLGIYMDTWAGGLLFVFIITLYLVFQFITDHLAGRSTEYLGIVGCLFFLVNFIFYLPVNLQRYITASVVIAVIIPAALAAASRYMASRSMKTSYYPVVIAGLAVVLVGLMMAISFDTTRIMFTVFRNIFSPGGSTAATTMEMQPFLAPTGSFSTAVAWGNFTTSFFLFPGVPIPGFGFISLVALVYLYIRSRRDDNIRPLFFIWAIVMLVLTLVQRRFAYYLVVNMALLSGWLAWEIVWLLGLRKLEQESPAAAQETGSPKQATPASARPARQKAMESSRSRRRRQRQTGLSRGSYQVIAGFVMAGVFLAVFLPNILKSSDVAGSAQFAPTDAWLESLTWMKNDTPEPLGSPDDYYELYDEDFVYPASAFGVTSWWDYGYWITRIAHRIPSANPSQDAGPITNVADLFLSKTSAGTENMTRELQTSYIIADYNTVTSKFWAIATWAGEAPEAYLPTYYVRQNGSVLPAQVFTPEYYQTAIVRLYNFGGQAVTKESPVVITYSQQEDNKGFGYRLVTETQQFDSYQAARDYVQQAGPSDHAVVGTNPFVSPIALEAVPGFTLVHDSKQGVNTKGAGSIPEVRVFEYTAP